MTTDYGMGQASHHNFGVGLSGMGRLRLWGKTLMLTGMANAEWSQYGFERWICWRKVFTKEVKNYGEQNRES